MFPSTLGEFLVPTALAGWVISLFLENTAWYQNLTPERKTFWAKVITWLFGIGVSALNAFLNPELFTQAENWYVALVPFLNQLFFGGATTYGVSQVTHAVNKRFFPQYLAASTKLIRTEVA